MVWALSNSGYAVGYVAAPSGQTRAILWRRLAPTELLDLTGLVESLCTDGVFTQGQCNSLLNKLNIATAMLNDEKPGPAINHIEAFINQVEAMMSGNNPILTPEQGQPLVEAALEAIAAIGS